MPKHNFLKNLQWRGLFIKFWKYIIAAIGIPVIIIAIFFAKLYIDTTYNEFKNVFIDTCQDSMKEFGEYINTFFRENIEIIDNDKTLYFLNQSISDNYYITNIVNTEAVKNVLFRTLVKNDILSSVAVYSKKNNDTIKKFRDGVFDMENSNTDIKDELKNITGCTIIPTSFREDGVVIDGITVAFPAHTYIC